MRVLKRDNELMAPPFLRRHVSKMAPCLGLLLLRPSLGAVFESRRSRVCFAAPRPAGEIRNSIGDPFLAAAICTNYLSDTGAIYALAAAPVGQPLPLPQLPRGAPLPSP